MKNFIVLLLFFALFTTTGQCAGNYPDIFVAIQKGDLPAVKAFIKKDPGALNRIVPMGNRMAVPLIEALRTKHRDIARWLIDRGADVNAKDDGGETPLQISIQNSDKDMILLILKKKGDVNLQGPNGFSPLQRACVGKEQKDIAVLLISRGAKLNIQDNLGMTALMSSSSFGFRGFVTLLLEKGANVSLKDTFGRTALDYAVLRGDKAVVKMLKDHGAKPGRPAKAPQKKVK